MSFDAIVGTIVIIIGLVFLTVLVIWSRRTIDLIAAKKLRSLREILKELNNER
jgi:hypothetical protein